jgi:hypothetical protein
MTTVPNTTYEVEIFRAKDDPASAERLEALGRALSAELLAQGLHRTIGVVPIEFDPQGESAPSLGVYLASPAAFADDALSNRVAAALEAGLMVIPVVDDLGAYSAAVPGPLRPINGWAWVGKEPAARLARFVLEQLGIEERQRRVFISHKREDGLMAAEQLHDALSKARFDPFIDRFSIDPGEDIQARIADQLENYAFMLLLETPLAYTSDWVYDEVDYALCHHMGVLILRWPGDHPEVPGSNRIDRHLLADDDLHRDEHDFDVLDEGALDGVLGVIEIAHASGMVRRRRNLVRSVEDAARHGGCSTTPLRDWRVRVECAASQEETVLGVTPRLPCADDLQALDDARKEAGEGVGAVLVHAARGLRPELRGHLQWVAGDRELTLIPEYSIGSRWTP